VVVEFCNVCIVFFAMLVEFCYVFFAVVIVFFLQWLLCFVLLSCVCSAGLLTHAVGCLELVIYARALFRIVFFFFSCPRQPQGRL